MPVAEEMQSSAFKLTKKSPSFYLTNVSFCQIASFRKFISWFFKKFFSNFSNSSSYYYFIQWHILLSLQQCSCMCIFYILFLKHYILYLIKNIYFVKVCFFLSTPYFCGLEKHIIFLMPVFDKITFNFRQNMHISFFIILAGLNIPARLEHTY